MFVDADARHGGGDRPERSADLNRSLRLGVPSFQLARAAHQHQENDRAVARCSRRAERIQVCQSQTEGADTADPEKVSACDSCTCARSAFAYSEHTFLPSKSPNHRLRHWSIAKM